MTDEQAEFTTELVPIDELKPHPRNYQGHPDDQLEEIAESLRAHGFYRNVVVAIDSTVLAGHGVVEASRRIGAATVPVRRLPYTPDDPRSLQVLAADNELTRRAERDDRALSELLRELHQVDMLHGTGYDEARLAALLFTTRPKSEVPDVNSARKMASLTGDDTFDSSEKIACRVILNLVDTDDLPSLFDRLGATKKHVTRKVGSSVSLRWPLKERRAPGTLMDPDDSSAP